MIQGFLKHAVNRLLTIGEITLVVNIFLVLPVVRQQDYHCIMHRPVQETFDTKWCGYT